MQRKNNAINIVCGRDELLRLNDAQGLLKDQTLIAVWSPGDYKKLEEKDPEYIEKYNQMMNSFLGETIRLEFWDTENNVPGYPSINDTQAYILAQFIDRNRELPYVIHCDAGQSRSAGIALAVECILKFDGDKYLFETAEETPYVKRFPRYSPNYFVFDKIIEMYHKYKNGGWVKKIDSYYDTPEKSPIGSNPFMEDFNESQKD